MDIESLRRQAELIIYLIEVSNDDELAEMLANDLVQFADKAFIKYDKLCRESER